MAKSGQSDHLRVSVKVCPEVMIAINFRENTKNINYDLWSDANKTTKGYGKGHNSNSFVAGLLKSIGIEPKAPKHEVPGFDKPVPSHYYGDE